MNDCAHIWKAIDNINFQCRKCGQINEKKCEWHQEDEDSDLYGTDCGEVFEIMSETPEVAGFKYCIFCGDKLKQVLFDISEE